MSSQAKFQTGEDNFYSTKVFLILNIGLRKYGRQGMTANPDLCYTFHLLSSRTIFIQRWTPSIAQLILREDKDNSTISSDRVQLFAGGNIQQQSASFHLHPPALHDRPPLINAVLNRQKCLKRDTDSHR